MWDGAFYRVRREGYEICFVPDAFEALDEVDTVDMWVILDDGERWSGTVCTLDNVRRTMDRWRETGECLDGSYFWVWDGLIVRDRGLPAMTAVIDHLVATGEYTSVFRSVGREDDGSEEPAGG